MATGNPTLKLKLTLGAVCLGVFLLVLQAVVQFYGLRDDLVRHIEGEQFAQVSDLARELDSKIDERLEALARAGSTIPLAILADPPALERHLRREAALLSLVDDLYIFDSKGVLLVDWPEKPGRRALDMSARDYIQTVQRTLEPAISQPILGKSTGQPIIVLAAPVFDGQGRLAGIIGGVLNLNKPNLLGTLAQRRVGKLPVTSILASADRVFIAHPDHSRILQPIPTAEENPVLDRAFKGFEGSELGTNSRGLERPVYLQTPGPYRLGPGLGVAGGGGLCPHCRHPPTHGVDLHPLHAADLALLLAVFPSPGAALGRPSPGHAPTGRSVVRPAAPGPGGGGGEPGNSQRGPGLQ